MSRIGEPGRRFIAIPEKGLDEEEVPGTEKRKKERSPVDAPSKSVPQREREPEKVPA